MTAFDKLIQEIGFNQASDASTVPDRSA
jgi:hypothetical protein